MRLQRRPARLHAMDATDAALVHRPVADSVEHLLASAEWREPLQSTDSKSGARFERVMMGGECFVVKHLHVDDDWIMRSTGDLGCRPMRVWQSGLLDRLPAVIDHVVVGAAVGEGRNGWGAALLMHDVTTSLVPAGDERIPLEQHLRFLDHMAALHASFWGWEDTIDLLPPIHRLIEFSPEHMVLEGGRGWPDAVPPLIIEGWKRFPAVAGRLAKPLAELVHDPTPLVGALALGPQTFVHGDWKLGNLGSHPDGRTILLDWAMPGQGCGPLDLSWYLALNTARLPQRKEDAIDAYRRCLERRGIETAEWWDRIMGLSLVAGLVWFGWEKALGGPGPELQWWLERVADGLRWL
jgi:hypothetical protein